MAYTTIDKPSDYFNTKLYTGTGSSQSITGVGFQPDWIWIKYRGGAGGHNLFDSVRGALKRLRTDSTNGETTTATDTLTSFDSDGFSLGADTFGDGVNLSGYNNVAWNWLAGGTGSSNTDGSITSTVSANTTSGFSIVSFTGTGANATIGHGLGVVPDCIITKGRDTSGNNWAVYHSGNTSAPETDYLALNTTNATADQANYWNDTAPTSSVYSVGNQVDTNKGSESMIAYCFAEKKGYSKFGSYTGNGSTDGTFVYTGFKPAFVMLKRTDSAGDWQLVDNKRLGYNVDNNAIFPNLNNAEDTGDVTDIVSNGFKIRSATGTWNASGGTYIFMAFAESPFVTSTGIPTTAR